MQVLFVNEHVEASVKTSMHSSYTLTISRLHPSLENLALPIPLTPQFGGTVTLSADVSEKAANNIETVEMKSRISRDSGEGLPRTTSTRTANERREEERKTGGYVRGPISSAPQTTLKGRNAFGRLDRSPPEGRWDMLLATDTADCTDRGLPCMPQLVYIVEPILLLRRRPAAVRAVMKSPLKRRTRKA
jgi:hypothetical protein